MEINPAAVMTQPLMLARKWASTKFASFFWPMPKAMDNPQEAHFMLPPYQQEPVMQNHKEPKLQYLKKCDHESLPEQFKVVAEKRQNNNTCNQATLAALNNTLYEDAEINITLQLLKTIRKRKWLSNQLVSTYSTACRGFSPFAVPELSEDTIDKMNKQAEALEITKSTTAMEICKGLFQKPMVDNDNSELLQYLRCYANLCYGLLGSTCPLCM
eukprot:2443086-Ditylum_brightwellii.AAC.5